MAQMVTVQLVDDLGASAFTEGNGRTVNFGFDGSDHEIDLSNDNADKLRDALFDHIAAARKVNPRRTGSSSSGGQGERPRSLQPRGASPTQVAEAHAAAH